MSGAGNDEMEMVLPRLGDDNLLLRAYSFVEGVREMKKLFATFAAVGLAAAFPHAAHAMECCKDGTCECCKKDDATAEPAPEGAPQH